MNLIETVFGGTRGRDTLAGRVLETLVRWHGARDASIADLARVAGGTASSTMREVNKLIEVGLVVSEEAGRARQLRFNADCPFAAPVLDLVFISTGTEPSKRHLIHTPFDDGSTQASIGDYVPPEMLDGWARRHQVGRVLSEQPVVYDGPSPEQARALVLELRRMNIDAGRPESWLQAAYLPWRNQRDRSLVHYVLHAGEGSHYAAVRLTMASLDLAAVEHGGISGLEWARAVYGVWAEKQTCYRIFTALDRDLDVRDQWEQAHRDQEAGQLRSEDDRADKAAATIAQLQARYHDIDVLGQAGERILTVAAHKTGDWARRTAVQMAAHPSFQNWKQTHPDIVEQYPGPVDDEADLMPA